MEEKEFNLNIVEIHLIIRSLICTLEEIENDSYFYTYNMELSDKLKSEENILSQIIDKFIEVESDLKCVVKV